MKASRLSLAVVAALVSPLVSSVATADGPAPTDTETYKDLAQSYSPYASESYPAELLWGDTHLHTSFSFDAGMVGNRLGPEDAYRFARGDVVVASLGVKAKLSRPLDFLAVSDHAESLGIAPAIMERSAIAMEDEYASQMRDLIDAGTPVEAYKLFAQQRAKGNYVLHRDDLRTTMWQRVTAAAEKYNEPGVFTALIGYEYTSAAKTNNLHRVVLFRDSADLANKVLPFSGAESLDPEDLWAWMARYEADTGGQILAIPHNGNLSNGQMFADTKYNGEPVDKAYAQARARWEPLYEATQIKGDGEAHPLLSPEDRFADFWTWDRGNFGYEPKTPDMLPKEYARSALKRGLEFEQRLGENPFKFGLIGSTDSHTSLATAEENNFFSKAPPAEPGGGQNRYDQAIIQKYPKHKDISVKSFESAAGGLVAVWATQNTREGIFDAMMRKEVYATTGPRIALRVFAGVDFPDGAASLPDTAAVGYQYGVPMGATVTASTKPLQLLISAMRDPIGANLDRVQVVKGWLDRHGVAQEKVYNVAWSDGRSMSATGDVPDLPSTVNGAEYSNSVGAAVLNALWQDPDYDPVQRAFYYVRVLEIETPTWLAYDKAHFGNSITLPETAKLSHQERAYSSPIWVQPID